LTVQQASAFVASGGGLRVQPRVAFAWHVAHSAAPFVGDIDPPALTGMTWCASTRSVLPQRSQRPSARFRTVARNLLCAHPDPRSWR
jgi:hypothetical protein